MIHWDLLDIVARGGGGGSSSGSGGGGILVVIGYLPAYYGCRTIKRHLKGILVEILCGLWVLLLSAGFLIFLLPVSPFLAFVLAALAVAGGFGGYYDLHKRLAGRIKKSKEDVQKAATSDRAWNYDQLISRVQTVFMAYQTDWSNFNLAGIQKYTTKHYYYHNQLMLAALHLRGRQNLVKEPKVLQVDIIEVNDDLNNAHDYFIAYVSGQADDQLVDTATNEILFEDNNPFEEYWRFERIDQVWMLAKIYQATANEIKQVTALETFANQQGFCYSADWGWLLLPKRGQLFSRADFGTSDINNHVIGVYHDVLIEMYTYVQAKKDNNIADNYLIAQTSVPKSYGNIVVRHKKKFSLLSFDLLGSKINGLTKLSTEWGDFNKKYDVFASDTEKATSFELLNPKFMEQLEALIQDVNIEVVDNVVYIYSKELGHYESMLEVLKAAFKEMKM